MLTFSDDGDWAREVAEVSTLPEFQNAQVRFVDPSLIESEYDPDTAEWTVTGDGVLYSGQARVIGVRWGVFSGGASNNPGTETAIRIQVPRFGAGRVRKGVKVYVDDAPFNPVLETYLFAVTSDMQGSAAGARTFECALAGDVELPDPPDPVSPLIYGTGVYGMGTPYGGAP